MPALGRSGGSLHGNDDLDPVRERRREVDERDIGTARLAPPARANRVGDARALGQPVQPRPVDRAHHVDDELRALLGRIGCGAAAGVACAAAPACRDVPPADQEHEPENERAGEKPPARGGEGVQHVLHPAEEPVTRGCRDCAETVSPKDVTLGASGGV